MLETSLRRPSRYCDVRRAGHAVHARRARHPTTEYHLFHKYYNTKHYIITINIISDSGSTHAVHVRRARHRVHGISILYKHYNDKHYILIITLYPIRAHPMLCTCAMPATASTAARSRSGRARGALVLRGGKMASKRLRNVAGYRIFL